MRKKRSRRALLIDGMIIGGAVLAAYAGINVFSSKVSFEKAQKDVSLRQKYVDKIVEEEGIPELGDAIYDPSLVELIMIYSTLYSSLGLREETVKQAAAYAKNQLDRIKTDDGNKELMISNVLFDVFGRKIKVPLFVHENAFDAESVNNDDEFRSIMVDHEFVHIRDTYHGMVIGNDILDYRMLPKIESGELAIKLISLLGECKAYYIEIKQIISGKRSVRKEFFDTKAGLYWRYYSGLENYHPNSELEKRLIKAQLALVNDLRPELKGKTIYIGSFAYGDYEAQNKGFQLKAYLGVRPVLSL